MYMIRIIKGILGAILLISGVSKIIDPLPAMTILDSIKIFPNLLITPTIALLPIIEIALALGLLAISKNNRTSLFVCLLFLFFFVFSIFGVLNGLQGDCGCFGSLIKSKFDWLMVLRNFFFSCLSSYLFYHETHHVKKSSVLSKYVIRK